MHRGTDASTSSSNAYPSGRTFSPAICAVAIRNRLGRLARSSAAAHQLAALGAGSIGSALGVHRLPQGARPSCMISSAERWKSSLWDSSTLYRPLFELR